MNSMCMCSKVSNLFEPLVDQHYKVASHKFDVFRKLQIHLYTTSRAPLAIRYFQMNSMCFESFESVQTTSRPALLGRFR